MMVFLWQLCFCFFWQATLGFPQLLGFQSDVAVFPATNASFQLFEIRRPWKRVPPQSCEIFTYRGIGEGRQIARMKVYQLFRLEVADIDGNGRDDLLLGVIKIIGGKPYRRVYVFNLTGAGFSPRWLGSRLAWVLDDFHVATWKGKPALHSFEHHLGKSYEGWYLWDHWGFRTVRMKEINTP